MAAAVPLDDDRWPWLDDVGRALADAESGGVVVACSALRRVYRDRLRLHAPDVLFVHLRGSPDLLARGCGVVTISDGTELAGMSPSTLSHTRLHLRCHGD